MTKADTSQGASSPEVTTPQPAQVPVKEKHAQHPALELSLAVISVIASAWLSIGALTGAIGLFGDRMPSYDAITALFVTHLSGFAGLMVTAALAVVFAGAALWLFCRVRRAIEDDSYKTVLQAGVAVAVVKTVILAGTAFAVALTPLLTIRKGVNAGEVYLYEFLPLIAAVAIFAFVAWYLLKLVGRQQVGKVLSVSLVVVSSLVFILSLVAVIVQSHNNSATISVPSSSSSDIRSFDDYLNSQGSNGSSSWDDWSSDSYRDNSRSSSGSSSSACYDEYLEDKDLSAYSDCLQGSFSPNSLRQ